MDPFRTGNVVCPVLIGREPYLAALDRAFEDAGRGGGQTIIVAGEAGIGKSRLIAEAKQLADRQGWLVLKGQCVETDRSLPYAPVLDILRGLLDARSVEEIRTLLGPAAAELAAVSPGLAVDFPAGRRSVVLEPAQQKRRLFDALGRSIAYVAELQPALIIVEDLHWSDDLSLEFLLYIARQITTQRILLLLSCRDDEQHPQLEHTLAELERERIGAELHLMRLPRFEVDAMLRTIFGLQRPVSPLYVDGIHALTDGNPFFIEEILGALVAAGEICADVGAWDNRSFTALHVPRTVQDAVRRRSRQLSPDARQVLGLASVAGRSFGFDLLQELTERDETALLELVREWIAAQLVVEESADQFAFRHALTQRAIYTALLARERRSLHGRILETMERLYGSSPDTHLSELAYHAYEAGAWEQAYDYALRVGELAQAIHAPRAVVTHFTRALDAASQLRRAPSANLYRGRGQAYDTIGEFEHAREDYESALSAARTVGDRSAEWQALTDLGSLWAGREYARAGAYFRQAIALAQELGDRTLRAHSLNRLGNWLVNVGRAVEGLAAHQEALAIFEALPDRHGMAETHDLLGQANGIYGDVVSCAREYERAIALFREIDERAMLSSSLANMVVYSGPGMAETSASPLGTLAALTQAAAEAKELARQVDWLSGQAFAEFTAGCACAAFGDFGRGVAHGHAALQIATEIGHHQWMAGARCVLGQAYVLMSASAPALQQLEAGLPLAMALGSAWWTGTIGAYLALAHLLAGAPGRARSVLEAIAPRDHAPRSAPERRILWAYGELALVDGESEAALAIAERLLGTVPGESTAQPIPSLLKLKGDALLALKRTEAAESALDGARRGALERGARPILWQVYRSLAQLYESSGRADLARVAHAEARRIVEAIAATIEDTGLRAQVLSCMQASLPAERTARHNALTARENEVAALIALGNSNRAIATTLFIGERTVETHISNMLAKLNFNARTQIAAWAVEQGLISPTR